MDVHSGCAQRRYLPNMCATYVQDAGVHTALLKHKENAPTNKKPLDQGPFDPTSRHPVRTLSTTWILIYLEPAHQVPPQLVWHFDSLSSQYPPCATQSPQAPQQHVPVPLGVGDAGVGDEGAAVVGKGDGPSAGTGGGLGARPKFASSASCFT